MKSIARIFKKQKDFYELLYVQSNKALEAISQLQRYMITGDIHEGEKIICIEREADELRKNLIQTLNQSLITPFEREDIFVLSGAIDDMVDYSRSTYEEMQLFQIEPCDALRDMAAVIEEAVKHINNAIYALKNHHQLSVQHGLQAKQLENEIEHVYRIQLAQLFELEDIRYVLKMREIFRHVSNLADKVDHAADVIGNIIIKNS